ncbi:MAG: hypothetical protein WC792_03230 [Candidatus Micrarchaeia archaeon]|jgi:hypothetical protein
MVFVIDDLLWSADFATWAFVAVACLMVIFFMDTPEAFFGFVDFPIHEYFAPIAYLILAAIGIAYFLPAVASAGFLGAAFLVAIIAFGAQAMLNITLEEGAIAGLAALIIAAPVFGF